MHSLKLSFFTLVLLLVAFNVTNAINQNRTGEIGISLGGTYYLGEYNKTPFIGTNLSAGAFYRHNIDTRFSLTGNVFYGKLSGKEENSAFIVGENAPKSFNNTFYEFSPVMEFNFTRFVAGKPQKYYFTPYVFAGGAAAYYPKGETKFILSIPFGMGVKYNLNHRFIFSAFAGMRKTFTDKIDYEYTPPSHTDINPYKQWGYTGNKDWYSVFGFSLSYKINYRMKCPAFD